VIFLIGYRGSGKTTVARLLAEALGWPWLDADEVLEQRHGKTIREIFATEGEAAFRDKEEAVLAELCMLERHVIATGGGVVLRESNRKRLKASGRVVWLTADVETIQSRLESDPATADRRPALTAGSAAEEIADLLRQRQPLYRECAQQFLSTVGQSPQDVVKAILRAESLHSPARDVLDHPRAAFL
jgi:shikimate kinase